MGDWFDRFMDDWLIPFAAVACVVLGVLLITGNI